MERLSAGGSFVFFFDTLFNFALHIVFCIIKFTDTFSQTFHEFGNAARTRARPAAAPPETRGGSSRRGAKASSS